jgi:enoyl-CoA hydratase/carnithine racemase
VATRPQACDILGIPARKEAERMAEVRVDRDDRGIVTVTVSNPTRRNAVTGQMFGELRDVFVEIAGRAGDRAVIVTGDPDAEAFCAGADLMSQSSSEHRRPHIVDHMRIIGEAAHALGQVPVPVVAKVNGIAVGAGLTMALGCDLVYASDRASFGFVFAKRGLSVDFGGTWLLPRLVGMHKAKEIALLADIFDAATADRLGIVNAIVPHDELDARVDEVAAKLAAGPTIALSMTKRMLGQAFDVSFAQALEAEAMAQAVNSGTKDTREAMKAFAEKRDPDFRGM